MIKNNVKVNESGNNLRAVKLCFLCLQLNCLQKKLHFALQLYYKYRGAYNKMELGRMEVASHQNTAKVAELQGTMDGQLELIADFLMNQMDGNAIRQLAMEKVIREEQEEARRHTTA